MGIKILSAGGSSGSGYIDGSGVASGSILPSGDNTDDLGNNTTATWRSGYFQTSVVTPSVDSGGSAAVTTNAGNGSGTLGIGGVIGKGAPNQATTGTTEEVLATVTIPANTLAENGSSVRVNFLAYTAANANSKQLRIRVGGISGTTVYDTGGRTDNNKNWTTYGPILVTRTGAATASVIGPALSFPSDGSSAPATGNTTTYRSASIDWTASQDLVITGQTASASGDLTLVSYTVEVLQ